MTPFPLLAGLVVSFSFTDHQQGTRARRDHSRPLFPYLPRSISPAACGSHESPLSFDLRRSTDSPIHGRSPKRKHSRTRGYPRRRHDLRLSPTLGDSIASRRRPADSFLCLPPPLAERPGALKLAARSSQIGNVTDARRRFAFLPLPFLPYGFARGLAATPPRRCVARRGRRRRRSREEKDTRASDDASQWRPTALRGTTACSLLPDRSPRVLSPPLVYPHQACHSLALLPRRASFERRVSAPWCS